MFTPIFISLLICPIQFVVIEAGLTYDMFEECGLLRDTVSPRIIDDGHGPIEMTLALLVDKLTEIDDVNEYFILRATMLLTMEFECIRNAAIRINRTTPLVDGSHWIVTNPDQYWRPVSPRP